MPLATAVWLIDNTALTFEQIADFCGIHKLEVNGIADGEIANNINGYSPVLSGELTKEEISRCEKDPEARMQIIEKDRYKNVAKKKKAKYVPIAKRRDKPDAIAWIVKNYPDIPDSKIIKLIGTTKKTIAAIRDRSHARISEIVAKDPVALGLCKQTELDVLVDALQEGNNEANS